MPVPFFQIGRYTIEKGEGLPSDVRAASGEKYQPSPLRGPPGKAVCPVQAVEHQIAHDLHVFGVIEPWAGRQHFIAVPHAFFQTIGIAGKRRGMAPREKAPEQQVSPKLEDRVVGPVFHHLPEGAIGRLVPVKLHGQRREDVILFPRRKGAGKKMHVHRPSAGRRLENDWTAPSPDFAGTVCKDGQLHGRAITRQIASAHRPIAPGSPIIRRFSRS